MRLLILTLLIIIALSPAVSAQVQLDSVFFYEQDTRLVSFAGQNATQLTAAPYVKLGSNRLSYQTHSGHFRQSQQAENNSALHFNTSGIQTLGRFKVHGSFDFERMKEDSLAYTMRGLTTDVSPYYYMAAKAGQYRRLNYTLKGLAVYELLRNKLYIASGINYLYNTTTRSVDPRPSIQTYQIVLSPQLVFKTGSHTIGTGIDFGYGTENLSVGYKNRDYSEGNTYPDRFLYLVSGYGYSDRTAERRFKRAYNFSGYHINYAGNFNHWRIGANFTYSTNTERNLIPLSGSENDRLFGTFQLNSYESRWLAQLNGQRFNHQLYMNTIWQNGYDNNVKLGGSNYKYKNNLIKAGYSILKHNSGLKLSPQIGFTMVYSEIYHRDISAGVSVQQTYVQPGLLLAVYKKYRNLNRVSFTLEPSVRLPQQRSISTIPGIFTYFTNGIVYPDYAYYNTTAGMVNTDMAFLTPHWFKNVISGISLNVNYSAPFKTANLAQGGFTPSGHRLLTSFSFNIYF